MSTGVYVCQTECLDEHGRVCVSDGKFEWARVGMCVRRKV